MFKVLTNKAGIKSIPWDLISPYEKRALINHNQTLEQLHNRGGLSSQEIFCIVNNLPFSFKTIGHLSENDADLWLKEQLATFLKK